LVDLRLLTNRLDDTWFFSAGIPWYATLFGRDSSTVTVFPETRHGGD
jgi:glycogen debranching enzyme